MPATAKNISGRAGSIAGNAVTVIVQPSPWRQRDATATPAFTRAV